MYKNTNDNLHQHIIIIFQDTKSMMMMIRNRGYTTNHQVTNAPLAFPSFSRLGNTKKEWRVWILAICICIWVTQAQSGARVGIVQIEPVFQVCTKSTVKKCKGAPKTGR